MDGMRGMVGSIKNIPKIFSGGIKVVGFANGSLGIAKDLNVAAVAGAISKTGAYGLMAGAGINNIMGNSSFENFNP